MEDPAIVNIVSLAQTLGLPIDPKLTAPDGSEIKEITTLIINGHLCHLRRVGDLWKRGLKHFRTEVQKNAVNQSEAVLLYIEHSAYPTRLYIVPSSLLKTRVFNDHIQMKALYLPVDHVGNSRARIDYTICEQAWHHLQ